MKIYIVSGRKTRGNFIMKNLKGSCDDVTFFDDENECMKSIHLNPDILILDDNIKSVYPIDFLSWIRLNSTVHVLYLSKNMKFNYLLKVFRCGSVDYILKDAYSSFIIRKRVERFRESIDQMEGVVKIKEFPENNYLKSAFLLRLKVFNFLVASH